MTLPIAAITGDTLNGDSMVALLMAAIAGFLLLTGIRRRQRERARSGNKLPIPRAAVDYAAGATDSKERLRRDLEKLIGELQDLSRKISAEIDTRFGKLEAAIRDADRRIAVLHRLSQGGSSAESPEAGAEDSQDQDIRYTVVYELADAGFSPVDIARDLGKTPGEIELILNLRRVTQQ